ncbi:MAG TPA: EF-Tu/IF-2/RF-3 family GTPase, partial [Anaerolineaceae bacterium]|nr:EF-Tu/IF-2/RF-3 family GTPase [Anaerolineaceae bacterium]
MAVDSITCPNCGASLALNPGQNLVTCPYCNSSLRVSTGTGAEPTIQRIEGSAKSTDAGFQMTVEDVFSIRNRGTVVTGRVASGEVKIGDKIIIQRGNQTQRTTVAGIEMFRKMLDHASAGDNIGLLLKDIGGGQVQRGDVLLRDDRER